MANSFRTFLDRVPTVFKYIIVLAVIAFISLLFPNKTGFNYEFEKGQTWRYDDLYAPFGYAILKTDEEKKEERLTIEKEFIPYYSKNADIRDEVNTRFMLQFRNQFGHSENDSILADLIYRESEYLNLAADIFKDIYKRGVLLVHGSEAGRPNEGMIHVVDQNNTSTLHSTDQFYDVSDAIDRVSYRLANSSLQHADLILPLLSNNLEPDITFDAEVTQKFYDDLLSKSSNTLGMIKKGDLIIARDGIVTNDIYQSLISFKDQYKVFVTTDRSRWVIFGGYLLLTSIIIGIFLFYLQVNEKEVFSKFSRLLFMMFWLVIYSYLVYVIDAVENLNAYLVPFVIAPIIIKNFYNERLALFSHIVIVLIASMLSKLGYEFTFLQILAGIVAVMAVRETRYWNQFFKTITFIFITYMLGYFGLSLIRDGSLQNIEWNNYIFLFIASFLTLLTYPLIPLLERLFGFTSSITLAELSDYGNDLLKDLSIKAPGTFQHSLQVSNLSEAAAKKIGINSLLVKVGALYHDIGKMKRPEYFIENQKGINPHDNETFKDSADIIIEHVTVGVKMAKKAKLPIELIDFILTHHGTTRVEYFYRKFMEENPDSAIEESTFRYPGPKPTTKEQVVMMLADSIEAATKSLSNPSGDEISAFVGKIIDGKIKAGQLSESALSFSELQQCKEVFIDVLHSIYHVRIKYPDEVVEKE